MESVILVNTKDEAIGMMEKMEAHQKGLLHRAFSVFIFNTKGELLLQQRALQKYHSAGLWTNTCCSHPRPGESIIDAAERRLHEEMGFTTPLHKIFDFVYRAPFENGLTEHEFDHVLVGYYDAAIEPCNTEVHHFRYAAMGAIQHALTTNAQLYTTWFKIAFPKVYAWWQMQPAFSF
ncbi:MAG: isopentenyl-diphosphate Delta-isomerase [Sphingobacteriales bacterium]|uniref:isopentenyl-diphosphate Delta-isomerase n=1 Tax=Hydrotalea flava TaxID=714549 RepID=UPI00082B2E7D|nr:isopentenyl-diphosphate Delta-isomerase [Hydrotalea flava]RTL49056.1 MAG: isopentenyl-diphosphate Delta-isomerase [Sphingobacteriales bacterium]